MNLVPFDGQLDNEEFPVAGQLVPFDGLLDGEEEEAGWGTAFKSALAGAGNAIDQAISLPAGALANYAGFQEQGDEIFRQMDERARYRTQQANPTNANISGLKQAGAIVGTLPAQILAMPGQAAGKGIDLIQRGEPLSTAIPATAVETGLAAAGIGPMQAARTFAGRAAIGAGANVAFGAGSDAATQLLATQEATREAYDPYNVERRLVEAATGGVLQGALGERPMLTRPPLVDRLGTPQQPQTPSAPTLREITNEEVQLDLFDQPEQGRMVSPYEATPGDWRIDENGMPVRVDLSLDAQAAQTPLQRDMFGEAIDPSFPRDPNATLNMDGDIAGFPRMSEPVNFRNDPENQTSIQFAMDDMPPADRTAAIAQTRLGQEMIASGELQSAAMAAESLSWLQANRQQPKPAAPKPGIRRGRGKRQSGALLMDPFGRTPDRGLQDLLPTLPVRLISLEEMGNRTRLTVQELQKVLNREGVPAPEKELVRKAFDDALGEDSTSVSVADFVRNIETAVQRFTMLEQETQTFANYGLERIGRGNGREFDTGLLTPEEQAQFDAAWDQGPAQAAAFMDSVAADRAGIVPRTSIWEMADEFFKPSHHFSNNSYFGHTRSFDENGVRHVVEVQSDLIQNMPSKRSKVMRNVDDDTLVQMRRDISTTKATLNALVEAGATRRDIQRSSLSPEAKNYILKRWDAEVEIRFQRGDFTIREQDVVRALARKLQPVLTRLGLFMTNEATNRLKFDTNPPKAKPISKSWFQQLIRNELSEAAKRGDSVVRFATADTMAKVEGWRDNNIDWAESLRFRQEHLANVQSRADRITRRGLELPQYLIDELAIAREDVDRVMARKPAMRFNKDVQGIYDRYQKDVAKYLESIGGKIYEDSKGSTWFEVPVEPSRRRPILFRQRGMLYIGERNKIDNALAKSPDGTYIPTNPEVAKEVAKAIEQGKQKIKEGKSPDIDVFTYLQSGSTSTAMKTGNPVIKAASEIVQNALKRAELGIKQHVFPAEDAVRVLKKTEIAELADVMKAEMFSEQRYSPEQLAANMTPRQLEAYTAMRELFDKTLDVQNAARVAKGQEPITAKEAYLSSRWQGDFRQPVYDADGRLVWYLAATTRRGLNRQIAALKKQDPSLVIDPTKGRIVKTGSSSSDLQSMYTTMLDVLGRDDPAVAKIKQFIEDQTLIEGEGTLAQTKHFEAKGNVRGFVGDRPGMQGPDEAIAMMQQQIQYAKNAFRWSEMQRAAEDMADIVSNPELQQQQPNTVKYVREYFKNAIGMGEAKVTRALEDTVREGLGVSPAVLGDAIGDMKSFFILQKLALSPGYILANMIQMGNIAPYLADMANQGIVGNPVKAMASGMLFGPLMGISHIARAAGDNYAKTVPEFELQAWKYAEDNGVTARSIYDEAPIEDRFSAVGRAANLMGKTMTAPEILVRSVAFMTYAQFLKDSGKYPDRMKLFQKAEELVNMSMVDYRETERPMMFSKAGALGNMMNTLQTFPMSFYNQFAYMGKQAVEGKPAGLAAILMFQYLVAGAMGLPYAQDLEKLYEWMRDNVTKDETYVKMMESPFFSSPRLWLMETLGNSAVYGYLADQSGIGITSRVAAPNPSDMVQAPIGPITDIAGQIGAVGSALMNPTDPLRWGQAAMKVSPVGLQGLLEQAPFMEGITYDTKPDGTRVYKKTTDIASGMGMIARTPAEEKVRNWGMRSQAEVVERDVAFRTQNQSRTTQQRAGTIANKMVNAFKQGDEKKVAELQNLYIRMTGRGISNTQIENQLIELYTTQVERMQMKNTANPFEINRVARMKKILDSMKEQQ